MLILGVCETVAQTTYEFKVAQGSTVQVSKRKQLPDTGNAALYVTFGRWSGGLCPWKANRVKYTISGGKEVEDNWNGIKTFNYKNYNQNYAIDGFSQYFDPVGDGYDECPNDDTRGFFCLGGWPEALESHTTFDIPCRGGYFYLEPLQNGTMTVYILQNGCIDIYDKQTGSHPAHSPKGYITWRPIFITDEKGDEVSGVTVDGGCPYEYTYQSLLSYIQQNGNDQGNPWIRWREDDSHVNRDYRNWITNGAYTWDSDNIWQPGSPSDERFPWKNIGERCSPVRVPSNLGGGYIVITKGYVKYTFPVKAGKTYFIFSNYTKIGFCGLRFTPDTNSWWEQPTETLVIGNNASGLSFENGKQYAQVQLANRSFKANTWTSICLPFTVSINQMLSVFGEKVETVHFNHIGEEDHVAYFDRHVYDQMIVAGVPVFIKPSVDVSNPTFYNVTVESPQPKNVYSEQYGYTFKGVYGSEDMGAYGYFINDKLYWLKDKTMGSGSMRAYFKATSDNTGAGAKALANISFTKVYEDSDSETTGIVEILSEGTARECNTLFDIYNLNGIKVRRQATSTEGLPKGIYVVNGKKVTVK